MRRRVRVPPAEARREANRRQHEERQRQHSAVDFIQQAMRTGGTPLMEYMTPDMLTENIVIIADALMSFAVDTPNQRLRAMEVAVQHCSQIAMLQRAVERRISSEEEIASIQAKLDIATSVIGKMTNPKSNITLTRLEDCPICFEKIVGPKIVCKNGHSICNGCLGSMLKTTTEGHKCPCCRVEL
tara:strand:- start:1048 stop:1602 length:555 start_codon:yes stop_codon:yes gene_type:complete